MSVDSRSRVEDILHVILGNLDPSVLQPPQSRVEALLQRLNEMISDFDGKIPIHICTSGEYDHETLMPTIENPNEDEFYLVPANDSGEDMYIEWIFTQGNRWERFGSGGGIEIPQSDWSQSDTTAEDYIKNKPDLNLKLDKNQGIANNGKIMGVNSSGNVVPVEVEGGYVTVTETLEENEDYSIIIEEGQYADRVIITGSTPSIVAQSNMQYICGEVLSLSFTPALIGISDVIFTSGSSATILTLPQTVKMPDWFEIETNTTYEISITDGVYGVVASWSE